MISVATLQEHLGVEGQEATLTRLEQGVVRFLQSWIPRYLGPVRQRSWVLDGGSVKIAGLIFHGQDATEILLPEEIAFEDLVSVEHRDHPSLPWEALDDGLEAYEIDGRGLYRRTNSWPAGRRNIRVTFNEGFEEDQGPEGVVLVALELIQAKWEARQAAGIKSEQVGDLKVTYADFERVPGLNLALNDLKRSRNF